MKKPNKNKEISEEYLRRAALFHLQKFDATEAGLRKVLERRVMSGCYQTDRNPEDYSDAINTVVQHCIDLSYVNDQRYAERLVEVSSERGMSKRQIQAKLLQKGVSSDLIEQTIDESDTDDLDAAIAYARKKRIGKFRAVHQIDYREKDLAKLARRGFSYDICEKVIDGKFDTYED